MVFLNKLRLLVLATFLIPLLVSACSASGSETDLASLDSMPSEVREAPVTVQQAYLFAVANPDVMKQIPCYCGCGSIGHTSNYACYVSGTQSDGSLIFDTHALGCSICVDITLDTSRLIEQGKDVAEIRLFIDQTYAQYGPSNMP